MPAEGVVQPTAIILSGGGDGPSHPLPSADLVIAADSGIHLADRYGLDVNVIVGDLDSADPARVDRAVHDGSAVDRHPPDKDATDLELAIATAVARGAQRVVIVGGGGGRLDHLLGIALGIGADTWSGVEIEWRTVDAVANVVRGRLEIDITPGDLLSVLPLTATATLSIEGTTWELDHETLRFGTTRGISNEAAADSVRIDVTDGAVLVVRPA
jgi:thiamine pyrophosphokinase